MYIYGIFVILTKQMKKRKFQQNFINRFPPAFSAII